MVLLLIMDVLVLLFLVWSFLLVRVEVWDLVGGDEL